jgi:hypothetical protein
MKYLITISLLLLICITSFGQLATRESDRVEIICPDHLEFVFPQNVKQNFSEIAFGGYPIASFKKAMIEGNKLVAVYDYNLSTYNDFAIKCFGGKEDLNNLPNSISLQVDNSNSFYNKWKLMEEIKIDRVAKGWIIEPNVIDVNKIEDQVKYKNLGWYGGTYSKTTQNNRQPKLYMEFDGQATVNESGTGFYIAGSISELSGNEGGVIPAPNTTKPDKLLKKPGIKPMNKKPVDKKKPAGMKKKPGNEKPPKKKP